MMVGTNVLAAILRKNGIPVKEVTDPTNKTDGCIQITDKIHVQVGEDYMCVNEVTVEGFILMGEDTMDVNILIAQIKDLL